MRQLKRIKGISMEATAMIIVVVSIVLFATLSLGEKRAIKKGLFTYTEGRVKKKGGEVNDWQNAYKNTEVVAGDRVRTYQRSRAELELEKLDVIRMAPQTTIDILKLYQETKGQARETQINIEGGDIWANIGKKQKGVKFSISTPCAATTITGTTLRLGVASDSTTLLKVYKGEVLITNAPERTDLKPKSIEPHEVPGPYEVPGPREVSLEEWVYIVKNMQKIIIGKDGQVKSMGSFTMNDKDEKTRWVQWNLQRDRLYK